MEPVDHMKQLEHTVDVLTEQALELASLVQNYTSATKDKLGTAKKSIQRLPFRCDNTRKCALLAVDTAA